MVVVIIYKELPLCICVEHHSWLKQNKLWLCAEYENTCLKQILAFLAHYKNKLGGDLKLQVKKVMIKN